MMASYKQDAVSIVKLHAGPVLGRWLDTYLAVDHNPWDQSFPTNVHAWPWACARSWNLQEMVKEKKTIVVLFASTIPFEWSSVDLRLPNSTSSLEVHSRVHVFPPLPYFRVSCRSIWSWHMILVQDNWLLWLIGICGMFKNIECNLKKQWTKRSCDPMRCELKSTPYPWATRRS